ncbi:hypothetical protein F4780DRAFT_56901 [Xylariomycetidae sp. FL0641]|nr:hypothetical protein F4780DRAFT_56901 [Xylariomycetidae sp. FL0641]
MASRQPITVLALDFGTTSTTMAYDSVDGTRETDPRDVNHIEGWPFNSAKNHDLDAPKVRSAVAYGPDGSITWGRTMADNATQISWLKLLLLKPEDLPPHLRDSKHLNDAREKVAKLKKTPVEVVSDYLHHVWHHALTKIKEARGDSFLKARPIHIVVTIPAIWPDYAQHAMEQAIRRAGMLDPWPGSQCPPPTFRFISEPEAAAMATVASIRKYDNLKDVSFVVVDLGGATADLISFQSINQQCDLKEILEGDGGMCGAIAFDEAYITRIAQKLADAGLKPWEKLYEKERQDLRREWEILFKRTFTATEAKRSHLMDVKRKSSNRKIPLYFEPEDLDAIFKAKYDEVHQLIEKQVQGIRKATKEYPKFIFLVGGFGQCPYIFENLQAAYEGKVEVRKEEGRAPWTAVVRGAVMAGLENKPGAMKVLSRIARYSYCWVIAEVFDKNRHHPDDKRWDPVRGKFMAEEQAVWFVKRGESLKTKEPLNLEYTQVFASEDHKGVQTFTEDIYRSLEHNPPIRKAELVDIKQEEDGGTPSGIEKFAAIQITTPCPVEDLPRAKGAQRHYRLDYRVTVTVIGARLQLTAWWRDREIGKLIFSESA